MSTKINITQELSPSQIFEQMVNNTYKNFFLYSHCSIHKEYIYHRKNIFNILHKIMLKFGFKSQVFFLSANYLDIIFSSKKINIPKFNIYTIALAALSISAKFCEIDPIVPELQYFIKVYHHFMGYIIKYPISLSDLKCAEIYILKLLNYKLNYYTIYDFNSFIFIHGILKSEQENNNYIVKQILEKIYKKSRYYLDVALINSKLCFKYDALYLSIYILEKSIREILDKDNNMSLFEKNKENKLSLKDIMIKYFNIKYENNKQYQSLIIDEEVQKIFRKNKKEKNIRNDNKKFNILEKKENNTKNTYFNKTIFFPSTKKYHLNFDLNNLKNTFKIISMNKSLSKERTGNKTLSNLYSISTKKKRNINQIIFPNTSRNTTNTNIYKKLCIHGMEKNNSSKPSIQYSRYTYSNKYNNNNTEKNIIYEKKLNSSVEFKKKNINLEKFILATHKRIVNNSLDYLGKSLEQSNKNLYKKKLVHHSDNYKTTSSFLDEIKNSKVSYGIVKIKSNKAKKENLVEYNNKKNISEFKKNNITNKINYQLIKNNNKIISNIQNKENINICSNRIDEYTRKKQILLDNINNVNLNNTIEHSGLITKNLNTQFGLYHAKKIKEKFVNISKEKEYNNLNIRNHIHKYQKNSAKINSIQNTQKVNNSQKIKLSYLLGKQNTKLNDTLKEINKANSNSRIKIDKFLTKEDFNLTLPNKDSIDYFQTHKNYYHKIKYDKKNEEIIKNQQDKILLVNNNEHKKFLSSTIVINNNINLNIDNKYKNSDSVKYNNIYKKNKIPDLRTKKYLKVNIRNSVNNMNDTFNKTHIYTQTFENDFFRKKL